MLQNHRNDDNEEYISSYLQGLTGPGMASQQEPDMLEDYLDRVCAPLVGTVPRLKREEIRARVRTRINEFAAAHQELGSTPEEAIEFAIIQCGDATLISRRWLTQQAEQRQVQKHGTSLRQTLSDRLLGGAGAATATAAVTFGLPYLADVTKTSGNWWAAHSDNTVTYYRICLFAIPLISGILTGITAKHKPVRGVVNALAIMTIPAIIIPGLVLGMSYAHIFSDQSSKFIMIPNPLPGICGLLPWLAMGSVGASLGSRLRGSAAKYKTRIERALSVRSIQSMKFAKSTPKTKHEDSNISIANPMRCGVGDVNIVQISG